MGLAGAGAGAADALKQILADRYRQQQQGLQNAVTLQDMQDRANQRRLQNAQIVMQGLTPGADVSAADVQALQGTPYASRLETRTTLPSRTIPLTGLKLTNAGGESYTTLRATPEEQRRIDLSNLVANGGLNNPTTRTKIVAGEIASGRAIPTELLKSEPQNEAAEDRRYEQIVQRVAMQQPVSPEERAFVQAYERRKTLGPEASAAAAADRQAKTIAAQVAQQGRAQDFTEREAGRKELADKVEQPYLDSREKADLIRGIVAGAKNGNMVDANVQSLAGLLGLVTGEGVKRINGTELAQVQGAGSLIDRIRGSFGKVTSGQPLDPKLQSDLLDLAGQLERSARIKYERGFKTTTNRYGLSDEQLLPDDATPAPSRFQILSVR